MALVLAIGILLASGGTASAMLLWENEYDHHLEGARADTDNMPRWWEYEELPDAGVSYWKEESWAPVPEFHDTEDYVVWEAPHADTDGFELDATQEFLTWLVIIVDTDNTDMPLSDRVDAVGVEALQDNLSGYTTVQHDHSFGLEVDERPAFESHFSLYSASNADIHAKILSVDLGSRVVDVVGFTNRGDDSRQYSEISNTLDSVEILD